MRACSIILASGMSALGGLGLASGTLPLWLGCLDLAAAALALAQAWAGRPAGFALPTLLIALWALGLVADLPGWENVLVFTLGCISLVASCSATRDWRSSFPGSPLEETGVEAPKRLRPVKERGKRVA